MSKKPRHSGLPYFAWFGKSKNISTKKIPSGMYLGMGLAALSCLVIGIFPNLLYNILPFQTQYQPYTGAHLWESISILFRIFNWKK